MEQSKRVKRRLYCTRCDRWRNSTTDRSCRLCKSELVVREPKPRIPWEQRPDPHPLPDPTSTARYTCAPGCSCLLCQLGMPNEIFSSSSFGTDSDLTRRTPSRHTPKARS